jgi:hypothetical protein
MMNIKHGRPNQGKTETIKKRAAYVYLPTEDLLDDWKSAAAKAGLSLSEYIVETVERVRSIGGPDQEKRFEMVKQLADGTSQLHALEERFANLEKLYKTRDSEANLWYDEYLKRKERGAKTTALANKICKVMRRVGFARLEADDVARRIGIDVDEHRQMEELNQAKNLLEQLGLLSDEANIWTWHGRVASKRRRGTGTPQKEWMRVKIVDPDEQPIAINKGR